MSSTLQIGLYEDHVIVVLELFKVNEYNHLFDKYLYINERKKNCWR